MGYRPRSTLTPDQLALPLFPVALRRVEPSRNMARFYSLDVERDLFGSVVLVRRWGGSARLARCGRMSSPRRGMRGRP
jgi:hypothetical protein